MGRQYAQPHPLKAGRLLAALLAILCLISLWAPGVKADVGFHELVDTYAQSVYMLSLNTQQEVYAKFEAVRRSPASLTKIMTALVVLELSGDPTQETVTVPDNGLFDEILSEGGANISLQAGETLTVQDLLYAMMLPSACDAAELLAWHFGNQSVAAFVEKMNAKALALGLKDTHFANPHGLEANKHYSSAKDMAVILQEALKMPLFDQIVHARNYVIPATQKSKARTVSYTIAMLNPSSSFYYPHMYGVKSGYTNQAGRCLASIGSKNGMDFLLVVMGCNLDKSQAALNQNLSYADTKALYEYAFENLQAVKAVAQGRAYGQVAVEGGTQDTVTLTAAQDLTVLCYKNAALRYVLEAPKSLKAPLTDATVGTLKVMAGQECLAEVALIPSTPVSAVVATTTQKPSPYTAAQQGNLFTNDPVTVILLLSLAILILLAVLFTTLVGVKRSKKNTR